MALNRRELLAACAGGVAALACGPSRGEEPGPEGPQPLGVVIHSYGLRLAADRARGGPDRIDDPLTFLDHCHKIGARGVQVGLGVRDLKGAAAIKEKAASFGMYLEGVVRLPRNRTHLERFKAEINTADFIGAKVIRTVMLDGRRYETFDSADAFRRAADDSYHSLVLAKEAMKGVDARLAVENHKDFRADELIAMLKRLDGDQIGVCLDTGNSLALLEDPMEVVEALAPWAITVHLKDMGVEEYERGFLLSEMPLGEGFLDLRRIVRVLRAARPEIRLNLEMITRDPLQVPCLTEKYWATFETLSGRHLVRTLALVRAHAAKRPLPRIGGLGRDEKVKLEDENVRRCLASARSILAS